MTRRARGRVTLGAIAVLATSALAAMGGCSRHSVDTSAIPTANPASGTRVCGVLPKRAVELAVGVSDFSVKQDGSLSFMKRAPNVPAGCFIYPSSGHGLPLMDVTYDPGHNAAQNRTDLQRALSGQSDAKPLPTDIGSGFVDPTYDLHPKDPSAQARRYGNGNQLEVDISKGPKQRNQANDVLAIMRLLKPYLPS